MKVVFQYQGLITDEYKDFFRRELPDDIELVFSEHSDPDKLANEIEEAEILVGYRLSEKLIRHATKLEHLQIPWTGFNRLGREHLNGRPEITVSNSHSNSLAIAEHAVALLVAAAKLIPYRHNRMQEGDWTPRSEEINSYWLTGKKVGILGYGAIGKKIARMMKNGFNCDVLAMRRSTGKYDEEDKNLLELAGSNEDLDDILETSDFIFVAVPQTEETTGMIGVGEFARMKSTAILVNIARGPVIEEEALFNALRHNKIGGAGIDVWYNYPSGDKTTDVFQNFPFEELDNIVMSPHSAFKVRERVEVFSQHILDNILRIYEGDEPINQVDLDLGY